MFICGGGCVICDCLSAAASPALGGGGRLEGAVAAAFWPGGTGTAPGAGGGGLFPDVITVLVGVGLG